MSTMDHGNTQLLGLSSPSTGKARGASPLGASHSLALSLPLMFDTPSSGPGADRGGKHGQSPGYGTNPFLAAYPQMEDYAFLRGWTQIRA